MEEIDMVKNMQEIEIIREKMKEYEEHDLYIEMERSYKIQFNNS